MVLKKTNIKKILFLLLLFESFYCSSQENSNSDKWWQATFQQAFLNSSKIRQILNDYSTTVAQKKQYDYSWFPVIQAGIQDNFNLTRGDYVYILNQSTESQHTLIMSPAVSLSIYQKLPGNGQLSLIADYAFSYYLKRDSYIQFPQFQLTLNQTLAKGAFGIQKDPEYLLNNEQINYNHMILERGLITELLNILNLIQTADILYAQEDYYNALLQQYKSEMNTANEKAVSGLVSALEKFYTEHQYTQTQTELKEIQYEKEKVLKELQLLIPDFDFTESAKLRNEFGKIICKITGNLDYTDTSYVSSIQHNLDFFIYESILEQYKLQYQNENKNFAPVLYISSSIKPDSNFNSYYSDWYKSFRTLNQTPYPIDFSLAVGIQARFELPGAKKLRKEIYTLYKDSVTSQMDNMQALQYNELLILLNQIESDTQYLQKIEDQLNLENEFRTERQKLYEQKIITLDEFYKSETTFFQIYSDYVKSYWRNINNHISVINILAKNNLLMTTLLGDTYENLF